VKSVFKLGRSYISLSHLGEHAVFKVLIGNAVPWLWTLEANGRVQVILENLRYVFSFETEKQLVLTVLLFMKNTTYRDNPVCEPSRDRMLHD